MYLISVEDHFESAHFLRGYRGKCENLHGHRYRVMISLSVAELDEVGMAYDFTELKKNLMLVLENYDHKCLNDIVPFNAINPTAENIAAIIYEKLSSRLEKKTHIDSVAVWESPESCAIYKPV